MTFFYDPAERGSKELRPGISTRTFWGENLLLSLVTLEANSLLPLHNHPQEQSTYIVQGELTLTVAGETRTLGPGQIAIIPGGVEHSAVVGDQVCLALDCFAPVREDFKY